MPEQIVIRIGERTTAEQGARKVLAALDDAELVTMTGGRSTVATMTSAAGVVLNMPFVVLDSVERHRGATWTFARIDEVTPST